MLKSCILGMVLLASACVLRASGEDSVIWWMFDADTEIMEVDGRADTVSISSLVARGARAGDTVNAIRLAAYDSVSDSLLGYLKVADGDGTLGDYYSMPGLTLDDEGDYADDWNAGPSYAVYAPYATTANAVFRIELGNWDEKLGWMEMAHSDSQTLAELSAFTSGDLDMQTTTAWQGANYVVPEPSSGLMLLLGGALLALRRRTSRA